MPNQQIMAEKIGISQGQLSRVFNDKPFGKTTAKKLGDYTGLNWPEFFGLKGKDIKELVSKAALEEGPQPQPQ